MNEQHNEIATIDPLDYSVSVNSQKEIATIQAQVIMAKRFPRNQIQALINMKEACKRPLLAEAASYLYPRAGSSITGPTIRLAETMAQYWGNLDYGIRELSQEDGESTIEAYCWDLENNNRIRKEFKVKHQRFSKAKGNKDLEDPRDIYENNANLGSRRLRACILGVIPKDIVDACVEQCRSTTAQNAKGDNGSILKDKLTAMVEAFYNIGIKIDLIEGRLKHKIDQMNLDQFVEYRSIYNSIKDGQSKREDWFALTRKESLEQGLNASDKIKTLSPEQIKKNVEQPKQIVEHKSNQDVESQKPQKIEKEVHPGPKDVKFVLDLG